MYGIDHRLGLVQVSWWQHRLGCDIYPVEIEKIMDNFYDATAGNYESDVDSGQDEPTFDKTNFGNKTDKFSAIKDFKI